MVTFTVNIPQMLAYIPYMDPMGIYIYTHTYQPVQPNRSPREMNQPTYTAWVETFKSCVPIYSCRYL